MVLYATDYLVILESSVISQLRAFARPIGITWARFYKESYVSSSLPDSEPSLLHHTQLPEGGIAKVRFFNHSGISMKSIVM